MILKWWATLESNQAWVSPAELQSAAAPCSPSPYGGSIIEAARRRQGDKDLLLQLLVQANSVLAPCALPAHAAGDTGAIGRALQDNES
jgi:hypothetical protein